MNKVLIITYYWPPSGGAGVQRWLKFSKYLLKSGIEPIVLTVDSQYATYPQKDPELENEIPKQIIVEKTKSFELYSFYKKVSPNKEIPFGGFANSVNLSLKEKILRFIRGNLFVPDPRRGWNKYAFKTACKLIKQHNIKTVITTSPPHSTQLIGKKLKKKFGINWIVDFRDPWTEIYYFKQLYPTRIVTILNKYLEKSVLTKADAVITVSDELKRLYKEKIRKNTSKITVIPNGFDEDDFRGKERAKSSEVFYISYVGTISDEYNSAAFIEAVRKLPAEQLENLRIRFVGKVNPKTIEAFKNVGLFENIEIIQYVTHTAAIDFMLSSNMLLLIIPDVKNNEGILTGKLFEYIACRIPILFIGPENGDAAKIINETGSGEVFGYGDSDRIHEALFAAITSESENKTELPNINITKYSRESLTQKLAGLINQLK